MISIRTVVIGLVLFRELSAVILGIILSQVTVLAIWAALGRSPIMWRAIATLLGSSLLALGLCAAIGEMEAEWFVLVWILTAVITACFLVLRRFRFTLWNLNTSSSSPSAQLQFSLLQVMALLTVVATLAAAGRLLSPRMATLGTLAFGSAIAVCLGVLALSSVWATLGEVNIVKRLLLLIPLTVVTVALVCYVMEVTQADPGSFWGIVVVAYASATVGTLMAARSLGLRLIRNPT